MEQRPWLFEAYKIAKGDRSIKVKREHVEVAMAQLIAFSTQSEKLRSLMKVAYEEAIRRRKENGLPPPPMPPGLNEEVNLPWIQKQSKSQSLGPISKPQLTPFPGNPKSKEKDS